MKKLILLLFFTLSLLMGAQKGSASLFVFFNGEPYTGMDVNIDGKVTYKTEKVWSKFIWMQDATKPRSCRMEYLWPILNLM